jgi:uncharacterized protein (DUF1499 family)
MPIFGRRKKRNYNLDSVIMDASEEQLLIHDNAVKDGQLMLHPRIWSLLGLIYVILGIIQMALAGLWLWWWGVAAGFGLTKLGTTLIGIGVTGGRQAPLPPGATIMDRLRNVGGAIVLWGSTKFQRLFYILRWPVLGFGFYVALLITIRYNSPDPKITSFPASCGNNFHGCSRVAKKNAQAPYGMEPLLLSASMNDTQAAVEEWISSQAGMRVLSSSLSPSKNDVSAGQKGFLHSRVVTPIWGFADDFLVGFTCDEESGKILVEAQGQLRIGKGDLGVNGRRNKQFYGWLVLKDLPQGSCRSG